MSGFGRLPIEGHYFRVVDPDWADPLDPTFAARAPGQRWNPSGLDCLYLSRDRATARSNVSRLFESMPYGPEDLDPTFAPSLLEVQLPTGESADAVTDTGLVSLGLPTSFPLDSNGVVIEYSACQPIGQSAFEQGLDGVSARSAAAGGGAELAWYPRDSTASAIAEVMFDQWW